MASFSRSGARRPRASMATQCSVHRVRPDGHDLALAGWHASVVRVVASRTKGWALAALLGNLQLGCEQVQSRTLDEPVQPSSASSSSVTPAQLVGVEKTVNPLGTLARARDYAMRVDSVKLCEVEPPFQPKPDRVILGIRVQLEGSSSRAVPANAFYALLRDSTGDEYTSTLAGCQPQLMAVLLKNGERAEGYISFEIPRARRQLQMRYAPQVIGPGVEELWFDVER